MIKDEKDLTTPFQSDQGISENKYYQILNMAEDERSCLGAFPSMIGAPTLEMKKAGEDSKCQEWRFIKVK